MAIDFVPVSHRGRKGAEVSDLRIALVEGGGSKNRRARAKSMDFRLHPDVAAKWCLTVDDSLVGSVDEDGTWTLRKAKSGQKGYSLRIGGGNHKRGGKVNGREGHFYFRFSCTTAQARAVFPKASDGVRCIECDLLGIEGDTAMFIPKVNVRALEFHPAGVAVG